MQAYESLMFREALKHGCYELQLARDTWRNACGPEGMDADLVTRYIEARSPPDCPFQNQSTASWTGTQHVANELL